MENDTLLSGPVPESDPKPEPSKPYIDPLTKWWSKPKNRVGDYDAPDVDQLAAEKALLKALGIPADTFEQADRLEALHKEFPERFRDPHDSKYKYQ